MGHFPLVPHTCIKLVIVANLFIAVVAVFVRKNVLFTEKGSFLKRPYDARTKIFSLNCYENYTLDESNMTRI